MTIKRLQDLSLEALMQELLSCLNSWKQAGLVAEYERAGLLEKRMEQICDELLARRRARPCKVEAVEC